MLAALEDMRASEDPQEKTLIGIVEGFTATARGQSETALRQARMTLTHAHALGISYQDLCWAWPLAARAAHELLDAATSRELLNLLDTSRPGQLAPMLTAERDLPTPASQLRTVTRTPEHPSWSQSAACAS